MRLNSEELTAVLASATQQVIIAGVVPLGIDWGGLADSWSQALRQNPDLQITVLCESDDMLFQKALSTDIEEASRRLSFKDFQFVRNEAVHLLDDLHTKGLTEKQLTRVAIEELYLPIPVSVVVVDGELYANLWLDDFDTAIDKIDKNHSWRTRILRYAERLADRGIGRKFACVSGTEVLELFDHERIPRGMFPRSSFYDTDYSQLVVWAFVFDRRGRLLIHKRKENAKDNRGMWDKSVGGHVDHEKDVDTSRAIAREVVEELFTNELKKQDIKTWDITDKGMLYVGEWRPDVRRGFPFAEISSFRKEWVFFRLRDSQHLFSPRHMPDGRIRGLRVIADVYLFVAGPTLSSESLGELENSEYRLIELADLKSVMDRTMRAEPSPGFDEVRKIPLFSPDLTNIMTGELRNTLLEFSNYIRRYIK